MNIRNLKLQIILFSIFSPLAGAFADEPDSAYVFAYGVSANQGRNGLHFAWSLDGGNWHPIGPEHSYLRCDYGRWGSQKRMVNPILFRDESGLWRCLWSVNEDDGVLACTSSADLINWKPQSYPAVAHDGNCQFIETGYNSANDNYFISWVNTKDEDRLYAAYTKDFRYYSAPQEVPEAARINQRAFADIGGNEQVGTIHKVEWSVIDKLVQTRQLAAYKNMLYSEKMADDNSRFANLKPVEAIVDIDITRTKPISDMLIGIFFEDINYAADGGIYAELIQNRGFEYSPDDKEGRDKSWNARKAWSLSGSDAIFTIDTIAPIHANNKHYAVLEIEKQGPGLTNEGFDGIALQKGESYDFSIFARSLNGKNGKLKIRLTGENGRIYGETSTKTISTEWKQYSAVITANETTDQARLEVIPQTEGKIAMDMISLFPQKTFRGRKNGLRADLAQTLADMKPRFVRFPGGCVAHGDGLKNMYRWKNTIGPVETRKPQRNLWGYHQTAGLGYYEYFQFCEDIGAEPLPVVPAGVPCQNSGTGGHGQQCGIPMHDMQEYIHEIFDLIEWANGDPQKNKWAKLRAQAGHPLPFNLKYIGIGNEDLISDIFEERYVMICNAVREKYPEITVVGTAGPFYEGSDYTEGWRIAADINLPMIDEHYYNPPGWYIHNQDFYDRYDRNKSKVYLGEYAAHLPGRPNNVETALAEALHLMNIERNGDVVSLTSYAPLLAKEGHTQWNPDLIYFNNTQVKPTVGYHVQKLFGNHSGDQHVSSIVGLPDNHNDVKKRIACSVVRNSKTEDLIIKLINLLPVAANIKLNIGHTAIEASEAERTILSGKPDDRNAVPVTVAMKPSDLNKLELPPYSLTILRFKQLQNVK
ncbi:MAG: carbohydrate binding domain-containing protein [Prolixibacteraceae bacterium]|nr:carbohydrate binding domain-containing protein [Prolixibacteraceae bacterium]